jgi:hypothetical protein
MDSTNPQQPTAGQQAFQQAIEANAGKDISQSTQEMLNKPWSDSKTALSPEDKAFLEDLISKINAGTIKLLTPSSILNQEVYEQLVPEKKASADIWINATLATIRQIHDFYQNPYSNDSDMMIAMVQELRFKKETLEKELGDVLKI